MTRTLLGLSLAAACIGAHAQLAFPLRSPDGAPACGNVGQCGRPRKTLAAPKTLLAPAPAVENRTPPGEPAPGRQG